MAKLLPFVRHLAASRNLHGNIASMFFLGMIASQPSLAADDCQKSLPSVVSGVVTLPKGCVYERPVKITKSDTVLDCNGAIFDGGTQGRGKGGFVIDSQGRPLENVVLKNCTIRNFKGGVRIFSSKDDELESVGKSEMYKRSPRRITLDNLVIEDNAGVGVYVDAYSSEITIQNSILRNNQGVGIYLEHSSRANKIINNKFVKNGYRDGKGSREAIAVDSSADNRIEGNSFEYNAAGGVFLYKNCGERMDDRRHVSRWQHSSNNKILNNRFVGEEVGVWIASRQSRNLKNWNCSDKPIDPKGMYFEDHAENNFVNSNDFYKNQVDIRVESDYNEITNNNFSCTGKRAIDMPRTKREEFLGKPQVGNVINKNAELGCRS